jgi:hypothetical protein
MRVFGLDALDQLAFFRMTGNDGIGMARARFERRLFEIEAQAGFAHLRIRPVATEAVGGQDGLHILVEIEPLGGLCSVRAWPGLVAAGDECKKRSAQGETGPGRPSAGAGPSDPLPIHKGRGQRILLLLSSCCFQPSGKFAVRFHGIFQIQAREIQHFGA